MALQSFDRSWQLFLFLILYTVGRTLWEGDQPVAMPLQQKHRDTSVTRVEFELTTLLFELAKTVHALDCAVTVIDKSSIWHRIINKLPRSV
jgi:hypothetical protein